MSVVYCTDIVEFERLTNCVETLSKNFDANNLPLTIIDGIKTKRYEKCNLYCKLDEKNVPILMCVQTPPHDLIICFSIFEDETVKEHMPDLIKEIEKITPNLTGVIGEKNICSIFSEYWMKLRNVCEEVKMNQRVFENTPKTIKEPPLKLQEDLGLFYCDPKNPDSKVLEIIEESRVFFDSKETVKSLINTNQYYYLQKKDSSIVTICSSRKYLSKELPYGRISYVYTPEKYRRKGYASWNVYYLCKKILVDEKSSKKLVLHTDLSNPTSNSIYKKVGFLPKVDYIWIKFNPKEM